MGVWMDTGSNELFGVSVDVRNLNSQRAFLYKTTVQNGGEDNCGVIIKCHPSYSTIYHNLSFKTCQISLLKNSNFLAILRNLLSGRTDMVYSSPTLMTLRSET